VIVHFVDIGGIFYHQNLNGWNKNVKMASIVRLWVLNTTFNNILDTFCTVLEETGVPGENH
jgi:hypothetical protein